MVAHQGVRTGVASPHDREAHMEILLKVLLITALGFVMGFFTFKVKTRWCPYCGRTTQPYNQEVSRGRH